MSVVPLAGIVPVSGSSLKNGLDSKIVVLNSKSMGTEHDNGNFLTFVSLRGHWPKSMCVGICISPTTGYA